MSGKCQPFCLSLNGHLECKEYKGAILKFNSKLIIQTCGLALIVKLLSGESVYDFKYFQGLLCKLFEFEDLQPD